MGLLSSKKTKKLAPAVRGGIRIKPKPLNPGGPSKAKGVVPKIY